MTIDHSFVTKLKNCSAKTRKESCALSPTQPASHSSNLDQRFCDRFLLRAKTRIDLHQLTQERHWKPGYRHAPRQGQQDSAGETYCAAPKRSAHRKAENRTWEATRRQLAQTQHAQCGPERQPPSTTWGCESAVKTSTSTQRRQSAASSKLPTQETALDVPNAKIAIGKEEARTVTQTCTAMEQAPHSAGILDAKTEELRKTELVKKPGDAFPQLLATKISEAEAGIKAHLAAASK
ncbi:hypothetical protein TRVL_05694 [Trypanosoma vivax]|nr:hypothetical protein TRVL_05694 [Trypanosoma vivax]